MFKKSIVVSDGASISESHRLALFTCLLLLFCLCISSGVANAQVLYGSLTGNVTDPQGALVPGAKIEALNVATGVARSVSSNANGLYLLNELQPGIYKVIISAANFGTKAVENVRVDTNNLVRVDVQLELKQQTESVTVTGAAPLLQTDRADVHTDLDAKEISDLPLLASNGRNFQSAFRIIPGAGLLGESNSALQRSRQPYRTTHLLVLWQDYFLGLGLQTEFLLAQAERRVGLTTPNRPPGTALTPALPGAPLPGGV